MGALVAAGADALADLQLHELLTGITARGVLPVRIGWAWTAPPGGSP